MNKLVAFISSRKTFFTFLLLVILLLPSQILMIKTPGMYPSHDGLLHIERLKQYEISLAHGQFPPRLAPTWTENIGYPLFVANYHLPYILGSVLDLVLNDPTTSYKSLLSVTYLLSAIFAFLLFKTYTKKNLAALAGAVVFSYFPYRFANIYTRAAAGESVALMFVPLALLSLHLIQQKSKWGIAVLSVATFGLLTAHGVIFLIYFPFFILYYFLNLKISTETIKTIAIGLILGFGLSAFAVFPIIFEQKYLRLEDTFLGIYAFHFLNIFSLFRIPAPGINIGTPFQIGVASTIILILSSFVFLFKRERPLGFFVFVIICCIFLTQNLSIIFWDNIKLLTFVIYPWRLLSVIALCSGFLASLIATRIKSRLFIFALIFIAIFSTRHYFMYPTQFESTQNIEKPGVGPNEYDTTWTSKKTFLPSPVVRSTAKITNVNDNLFSVNFTIDSVRNAEVIVRKLYFPGWRVYVNNSEIKLKNNDGLISFIVPVGTNKILLIFGESTVRKIGDIMSIFSFFIVCAYLTIAIFRLKSQRGKGRFFSDTSRI